MKFLPTPNTKFVLNYVKTDLDDNDLLGTSTFKVNGQDVESEHALIMRAQWMF